MSAWTRRALAGGLCVLGWSTSQAVMPRDVEPADGRAPAKEDRDQANPDEVRRIRERQRLVRELRDLTAHRDGPDAKQSARKAELESRLAMLAKTGTDRVLIILVEFNGTNTFTWTPGVSTWDPFGIAEQTEYDGTNSGNAAASSFFAAKYGITAPTNCRYAGPLHNEIPRPLSAADISGETIWTPDFSPDYYRNIAFGDGWTFSYDRADGSPVAADFPGQSVRDYYRDFSSGRYEIIGDVVGWVQVTNSIWYYGADAIPGRKSGATSAAHNGAIPGAGNTRRLVMDAIDAVNAAYPDFDWAPYDLNGDTIIDRLWIIHAGYGEEDSAILLNRTSYGESAIWSQSSSLTSKYPVAEGLYASRFIIMPENCGISVLAHEYAHNLGADDLYAYGYGDTSAGFWTLMADDWTGFPLGFLPQAPDPLHLDNWGWLDPCVISDPAVVHEIHLGQASRFPGGPGVHRAAKIELPDHLAPLAVPPRGMRSWWSGTGVNINGSMVLSLPLAIPAEGADLVYAAAYDTEAGYDFFRVLATTNTGADWVVLGSSSGKNPGYPAYQIRTNNLAAFAGQNVQLAFQYTTDYAILGAGAFVDDVRVISGSALLLHDDAETNSGLWTYYAPWACTDGFVRYPQAYYLQWRNTEADGGYDHSLGISNWRFGPVNGGLLVWHYNSFYKDNEIATYLTNPPSFGPKGRLLVMDAHPEPYRDPAALAEGIACERANVSSRLLMRDAPFGLSDAAPFSLQPPYVRAAEDFAGRPAVPLFSDALGYYPGLERALQPGSDTNRWMTVQWDASAIVPSATDYGVRARQYPAGSDIWYLYQQKATSGTNQYMHFITNRVAGGTALAGSGNPGATATPHGWNVRILSQTSTQACVRIWNGPPFAITSITRPSTSSVALHFDAVPERPVVLSASSNLAAGDSGFVPLIADCTNNPVTLPADQAHSYYRLGIP